MASDSIEKVSGCPTKQLAGQAVYADEAAQTFVVPRTVYLSSVWLQATVPTDAVSIRILNTVSGDDGQPRPGDNVLASGQALPYYFGHPVPYGSTDSGVYAIAAFDWTHPLKLEAGTSYALEIANPSALHDDVRWSIHDAPCDADGAPWLRQESGGWEPALVGSNGDGEFAYAINGFMDTIPPTGSVAINNGKLRTSSRAVTLGLDATDPSPSSGVDSMRLKNAGGSWTAWQPYIESKGWKLTRGAGKKTVYAQYRDAAGNVSASALDSITYRP